MASVHIPMLTVDAPVGKNKPNRGDDVLLVQKMLIAIITGSAPGATALPGSKLSASGKFDEQTELAIRGFQRLLSLKHPGKYPTDGVVTPIYSPEGADWTAKSPNGGGMTMVALNFVLRAISKSTHEHMVEGPTEKFLPAATLGR